MEKNLPTALVAADIAVFKIIQGVLHVYLTKVKNNNFYTGMDCLPGSLIRLTENAEDTVVRVLDTLTNMKSADVYFEQLYSFSDVSRDKRSRSVAIAHLGLMETDDDLCNSDDTMGMFVPFAKIKTLAFDHKVIVQTAYDRLRSKVHYSTIMKKLLPPTFTFAELQKAYEVVLGQELDKRNFRKKIMGLDVIKETGGQKKEGRMRPAMLYKWRSSKVESLDILGFD